GNVSDDNLKSGTTALICERPMVASCAILGGAPGTRDTELLNPDQTVETVDALVLSGGSAFGLDAAGGVQGWLRQQGRGLSVGPVNVPIVPAAILFDLINGGDKAWGRQGPYWDMGWQAAEAASHDFDLGSSGAGTGALTAGLKGGLGSASMQAPNGIRLGALVAVNALGRATMGDGPHFWAAPFEKNAEFGGLGLPDTMPSEVDAPYTKLQAMQNGMGGQNSNTTIGIIATDAALTKAQAKRLAIMTHDGFSRALWPSHTPMDGDLVFALSTGTKPLPQGDGAFAALGAYAAATMSRAIARGVYEAQSKQNDLFPTWRSKFLGQAPVG
ncbi:P1 family peptidase, partial [Cohaesibacter celericrescens]|uniref:P1 family peptidase n=1 Tax=Cohaesibacter celericrescens TaxID=2067669 RepID=UPI0035661AB8